MLRYSCGICWIQKYRGKFFGGMDSQLLVDAFAPENHFDMRWRDAKQGRQKSNHVVGCLAVLGRSGHADLKLRPFGLADGVLTGSRFAQNVDNQRIAVPIKKRLGFAGARNRW